MGAKFLKKVLFITLLFVCFFCCLTSINSAEHNVTTSDEFNGIKGSLNQGDTVNFADGVYENITIDTTKGINLIGSKNTTWKGNGDKTKTAIFLRGINNTIKNLNIIGYHQTVRVTGSNTIIDNVYIKAGGSEYPLLMYGANNFKITNTIVDSNYAVGLSIMGCNNGSLENISIQNAWWKGLWITNYCNNISVKNILINNTQSLWGMGVFWLKGGIFENITVLNTNNNYDKSFIDGVGVDFRHCDDIEFYDFTIDVAKNIGIHVYNVTNATIYSGNISNTNISIVDGSNQNVNISYVLMLKSNNYSVFFYDNKTSKYDLCWFASNNPESRIFYNNNDIYDLNNIIESFLIINSTHSGDYYYDTKDVQNTNYTLKLNGNNSDFINWGWLKPFIVELAINGLTKNVSLNDFIYSQLIDENSTINVNKDYENISANIFFLEPNLVGNITLDKNEYFVNETINGIISLKNNGDTTARNVEVKINLPKEFKLIKFNLNKGSFNEKSNFWTVGYLTVNETILFSFEGYFKEVGNKSFSIEVLGLNFNAFNNSTNAKIKYNETDPEPNPNPNPNLDPKNKTNATASMKSTGIPFIALLVVLLASLGIFYRKN